jgi:di/tricarboxylate transporter
LQAVVALLVIVALVMGGDGYRFGDYWRMGLPLEIAIAARAMPLLTWALAAGKITRSAENS